MSDFIIGFKNIVEYFPNVLGEVEFCEEIKDIFLAAYNVYDRYNYLGTLISFNPSTDECECFELDDSTNERFGAYITSSLINDDNEPYVFIDDYGTIHSGLGISTTYNHENVGNLKSLDGSNHCFGSTYSASSNYLIDKDNYKTILNITGSTGIFTGVAQNPNETTSDINKVVVIANLPIFDTPEHLKNYIDTGETIGLLNGPESIIETTPSEYYFDEVIYRYDKAMTNKTAIERVNNHYVVDSSSVRLIGYITDSVPHNIVFKAKSTNPDVDRIKCYHINESSSINPKISVFNLMQDEYNRCGLKGQVIDSTYIYYAMPHTNIPITTSESEADKYLNREKNIDDISTLNPTYPPDYNYKHTGDDVGEQDTEVKSNMFAEPFLSNQYILSYSQMEQVSNLLFSTEPQTLTEILELMRMYGENPISDVVDVVHIPINIEDFVNTESSTLKFASYVSNISGRKITAHGRVKNLGSTQISPIYNDFRDYTNIQLSLYLPFCAIIPLDVQMFMNSTITIKCSLDSRSHNLRYYIFCSNGNGTNLVEYHDCSIGKGIVVMGNDTAGKMRQNVLAVNGIINEQINSNISMGSALLSSVASLNPEKMIDTGVNVIGQGFSTTEKRRQGIQEVKLESRMTQAQKSYSGSQSPGVAESDILYPYLIFKIQGSILPSGLRSTYGTPNNIVTKLSNVSGFTMCDNLKLNCSATENELNEIYALAQGGIIL